MTKAAKFGDQRALLVNGATARGLAVFEGMPILPRDEEDRALSPIADWEGGYSAFLDLAKQAGVTFVYVSGGGVSAR